MSGASIGESQVEFETTGDRESYIEKIKRLHESGEISFEELVALYPQNAANIYSRKLNPSRDTVFLRQYLTTLISGRKPDDKD